LQTPHGGAKRAQNYQTRELGLEGSREAQNSLVAAVHHEGLKNNIQSTVKSAADTKKGNPHAGDALQEANGTQT